MYHLHKMIRLGGGDTIQVGLTAPAQVMLMDESNYTAYADGDDFEYYGREVKRTPFEIKSPCAGLWHLVIEQVDKEAPLSASVQIVARRSR